MFCAAALWAVLMPPDWGPEILPLVLLPETLVLAEGAEALAPPRGSETLFHTDRPLGAFGAKIALAARLGLINAAVEQSLPNLRRVRNAFAHSTSEVRLADPPYRDRLRESVALARRNLLWEPMQLILNRHMAERGEASQAENDPGGLSGDWRQHGAPPAALVDDDVGDRNQATCRLDSVELPIPLLAGLQELQWLPSKLPSVRMAGCPSTPARQSDQVDQTKSWIHVASTFRRPRHTFRLFWPGSQPVSASCWPVMASPLPSWCPLIPAPAASSAF